MRWSEAQLKDYLTRRAKPARALPTPSSRPTMPALSESAIQRAVFAHLAARGVGFAFHVPNGGWRSPIEAKILKGLGVVPGVPDLIVVKDGQAFALELKAEGGRLSAAQGEAIAAMRAAGAEVGVAFGLDAALGWLSERGLLRW
jgi:hypothetical protein